MQTEVGEILYTFLIAELISGNYTKGRSVNVIELP